MSLLRITTTPPAATTAPGEEDNKEESTEEAVDENDAGEATRSSGLLPVTTSFLRGLSLNARAPVPDVESQAGVSRAGT